MVSLELALDAGSNRQLAKLIAELQRAEIVEAGEVPAMWSTMNSTVVLRDEDTGETETYTLVYPHHADIARNRLSVLAPDRDGDPGLPGGRRDPLAWSRRRPHAAHR